MQWRRRVIADTLVVKVVPVTSMDLQGGMVSLPEN